MMFLQRYEIPDQTITHNFLQKIFKSQYAMKLSVFFLLGAVGWTDGQRINCSATRQYRGSPSNSPRPAPLRGAVGCVDLDVLDKRTLPVLQNQDAVNIYGPMEAGFTRNSKHHRGRWVLDSYLFLLLEHHQRLDYLA